MLALEFNQMLDRTSSPCKLRLKFLRAKLARVVMPDGSPRFMAVEKEFRNCDEMIKLTVCAALYMPTHCCL